MVLVSVVVPTYNSERTLAACLASIAGQNRGSVNAPVGVELVVVDNHSTDQTFAIAEAYADIAHRAGPERSAQRNIGARLASGDVVVFVDSDMVLEPNTIAEVAAALADREVVGVIIPERSFGSTFWARAKALEKLIVDGDPAVEAARAFRRDAFIEAGGYNEALTAFEDWDLADRLTAGGRHARTRAVIWHDEGALALRGTFAKKRYYGAWLPDAGGIPATRRRRDLSRLRALAVRHPVRTAGLAVMKAVEMSGFALGARQRRASGGTR